MYCCPSRSEPTTSICRTPAAGLARRCLAMDVSPFLAPTGGGGHAMRSGNPGDNVGRDHKLYLLTSLCGGIGDLSMLKASSLVRHDAVIVALPGRSQFLRR